MRLVIRGLAVMRPITLGTCAKRPHALGGAEPVARHDRIPASCGGFVAKDHRPRAHGALEQGEENRDGLHRGYRHRWGIAWLASLIMKTDAQMA
jgi:hypothetical protein